MVAKFGKDAFDKFLTDAFSEAVENNTVAYEGLGITLPAITGEMGENEKAIRKIIEAMNAQIIKTKELEKEQKKLDAAKPAMQKVEQADPKEVKAAAKAAELLKKRFTDLEQSLMAETELETFEYNKKLSLLDEYYKGRTNFDQNYAKLREQLETRHQKKLADISKREVNAQVDIFKSGQFQNLELAKLT